MKRILASAIAVLTLAPAIFAAKPTVYVQEFGNTANVKPGWVEVVRGAVLEGLNNTNRTELIDAVTEKTRYDEELRRLKENVNTDDLDAAQSLETRGAHALLNGDVTSFSVTSTKLDNGTVSYEAKVTFTLKTINALDGTMLDTKTFTLPKDLMGFSVSMDMLTVFKSEDEAVQSLVKHITKAMKGFVDTAFPLVGSFDDVEQLSKNGKEIVSFYAGLGSEDGIAKGQKLDIKVKSQIGKKTVLKTIGECEVVEAAGDDISLVKVKKGGAELKAAIDGGQTVLVTSQVKKK